MSVVSHCCSCWLSDIERSLFLFVYCSMLTVGVITHHNHSLLLAADSGILTDGQQQTTLDRPDNHQWKPTTDIWPLTINNQQQNCCRNSTADINNSHWQLLQWECLFKPFSSIRYTVYVLLCITDLYRGAMANHRLTAALLLISKFFYIPTYLKDLLWSH